jgi:hypothetical protein
MLFLEKVAIILGYFSLKNNDNFFQNYEILNSKIEL